MEECDLDLCGVSILYVWVGLRSTYGAKCTCGCVLELLGLGKCMVGYNGDLLVVGICNVMCDMNLRGVGVYG
jgi:hypothetical protein